MANSFKKKENAQDYLPDIYFNDLQGAKFNLREIKKGRNLLIIYFSPDCEFCQQEINDILKNSKLFIKDNIVLVSPVRLEELNAFAKDSQINSYPNVILLFDRDYQFSSKFASANIPTTYLYNQNHWLITYIGGGHNADYIFSRFHQ